MILFFFKIQEINYLIAFFKRLSFADIRQLTNQPNELQESGSKFPSLCVYSLRCHFIHCSPRSQSLNNVIRELAKTCPPLHQRTSHCVEPWRNLKTRNPHSTALPIESQSFLFKKRHSTEKQPLGTAARHTRVVPCLYLASNWPLVQQPITTNESELKRWAQRGHVPFHLCQAYRISRCSPCARSVWQPRGRASPGSNSRAGPCVHRRSIWTWQVMSWPGEVYSMHRFFR